MESTGEEKMKLQSQKKPQDAVSNQPKLNVFFNELQATTICFRRSYSDNVRRIRESNSRSGSRSRGKLKN